MDWKDYTDQRDWKGFWTDGERSELLKDALAFEKLVIGRGGVILHSEKIPFIKAGLLRENIYGEPNTPLFGEEINCPSLRRLSFESEAQYLERMACKCIGMPLKSRTIHLWATPMRSIELIRRFAIEHRNVAILIVAMLVFGFVLAFQTAILRIAFLSALIAIGVFSRIHQRFLPTSFIGVELIMLFTVISGRLFGASAGIFVGVMSIFLSTFITGEPIAKMFPPFAAIAVVGYFASAFSSANVSFTGLLLTILYDILISAGYLLSGSNRFKLLVFVVTHIAFNYYVFYNWAPYILSITPLK